MYTLPQRLFGVSTRAKTDLFSHLFIHIAVYTGFITPAGHVHALETLISTQHDTWRASCFLVLVILHNKPYNCAAPTVVLPATSARSLNVAGVHPGSSTGMNHDYGRTDGRCLLDQREFLAGEAPEQRVLEEVTSVDGIPCWQLKTW